MRHTFATSVLEAGHDLRTLQELRGQSEVATTTVYTHMLKIGGGGVRGVVYSLAEIR